MTLHTDGQGEEQVICGPCHCGDHRNCLKSRSDGVTVCECQSLKHIEVRNPVWPPTSERDEHLGAWQPSNTPSREQGDFTVQPYGIAAWAYGLRKAELEAQHGPDETARIGEWGRPHRCDWFDHYQEAAKRAQDAERERDLAVAHDRQPYPTADAYERVCAVLESTKSERTALRRQLDRANADCDRLQGEVDEVRLRMGDLEEINVAYAEAASAHTGDEAASLETLKADRDALGEWLNAAEWAPTDEDTCMSDWVIRIVTEVQGRGDELQRRVDEAVTYLRSGAVAARLSASTITTDLLAILGGEAGGQAQPTQDGSEDQK